jgi:ribosomal protein L28
VCYDTSPLVPGLTGASASVHLETHVKGNDMARSCAICGKVSMGGFNPQSSGMNRVRAHRRYQPNLQVTTISQNGHAPAKAMVCTRCRRTLTKSARA